MTLTEWIREHPPADEAFTQTIAGVAQREDFLAATRELIDELALCPDDALRARAIAAAPAPTGEQRYDAYLAALAEHLAREYGISCPEWALRVPPLERMWFVSRVPGFRAIALRESPAAFRRRGIFIARGSLERA